MRNWVANPKDSWVTTKIGVVSGKQCGVGEYCASYAINNQFPVSLNGNVKATFKIPDWKNLGAAGLICRADSLWSFIALYIYAPKPGAGEVVPVLISYRSGQMIPLAIGQQKLALKDSQLQMSLSYYSGKLTGVAISDEQKSVVETIASHNPFSGYVGVMRFYQAEVYVKDFEFKPILKQDKSMPEQINYKWDVFISHSSKDKKKVREIVSKLKSEGLKVWLDEEQIDIVDNVLEQIEEGLKYSNYIIASLSPSYGKSSWCQGEYRPIMNAEISRTDRKRVVALVIEDVNIDDIPIILRDKYRVDYNSSADWRKLVNKLHSP
jgi:hypothetical protein